MNRRDRRRAAAQARKAHRGIGYLHRLLAAQDAIASVGAGKVVHLACHHDPRCRIYTPCRECTCVPEMSAHLDSSSTVLEIDEQGCSTKRRSS
jgi:hypothetical protein